MVTKARLGPGDVFAYRGFVHTDGYAIEPPDAAQPSPANTSEVLSRTTEHEIVPRGVDMRPIYPLQENVDLPREFANVGDSDDAVLSFVNTYGWLRPWGDQHRTTIATVEGFRRAQRWIGGLVDELNALRATGENKPSAQNARRRKAELANWFNGEASQYFKYELRLPVSAKLDRYSPLVVVPDSLMSAMGLQLAHELTGWIEWKQCKNCRTWFPRGAPGDYVKKRNAETCSEACAQAVRDEAKAKTRAAAKQTAAILALKACPHCGDMFAPKTRKNATAEHCGKPACKTAASRLREKSRATK